MFSRLGMKDDFNFATVFEFSHFHLIPIIKQTPFQFQYKIEMKNYIYIN